MDSLQFIGVMIALGYPAWILICTFFILRRAEFDHSWLMFVPVFQDVVFFLAAGFWKWPLVARIVFLLFQFWFIFFGVAQFGLNGWHYLAILFIASFVFTGVGLAFLSVQMGKTFGFGLLATIPIVQLWAYGNLAFKEAAFPTEFKGAKTKVINEKKLEGLLRDCLDQGMTEAQILEYTKEAKISVAQVKRMLFDLRKGRII